MHKIENIGTTAISENNSESFTENEQSTVQLSVKSHCYTWTINDFSNCLKFRNCQFSSPSFIFQNTEWRLRLCVITENDKIKNLKIIVQNKSEIDSDLYFRNNISIVDEDGKVLSQADVEFCSTEHDAVYPSSPVHLVAPWGSESCVLPKKLIVLSEFSSIISEISEDTKFFLSKSDHQNVSDSQCGTNKGDTFVSPPLKRRTRRSVTPRTPSTFLRQSGSLLAEIRELLRPMLVILSILMMVLFVFQFDPKMRKNNKYPDAVPSIKSNEINYLIFDSTKKLNLIAEALNLTSVKEKSLEILALYSEMYNSNDHVQPVVQSIESNMTQSLASKISSFVASAVKQSLLGMNNDTEKSL